jgi:hypothetical protein
MRDNLLFVFRIHLFRFEIIQKNGLTEIRKMVKFYPLVSEQLR